VRRLIFLTLLASLVFTISHPARAEAKVQIDDVTMTHIFGERLEVQATLESNVPVKDVQIIIQSEDDTIIAAEPVSFNAKGKIRYTLDLDEKPIRSFARISIWFEIDLEDGTSLTSAVTTHVYDDNRFEWQNLQSDEFTVYWYQEDPELGGKILNAAYEGLARIRNQIEVPQPEAIEIYAYASVVDMQDTLMFSGGSSYWIAGHADSALGVIVVSLPPGPEQTLEIRRQIPHELVHILLYQKLGPASINLPRWLTEGLASAAELFPNPDYQLLLDKAYQRETLIPLHNLCASFPSDAANFQLSYAQAYAFTWYLQQTYGKDKIEALIQAYASGKGCDQGVQDVYGAPLSRMETDWRQVMFNENRITNLLVESLPLIVVCAFVFVAPIGLMFMGTGKRRRQRARKSMRRPTSIAKAAIQE